MKDENRFEMLPVKGSFGKATVLIDRRTGVNYLSRSCAAASRRCTTPTARSW